MNARDYEESVLVRCLASASAKSAALNADEANIFLLASKLVKVNYPIAAERLDAASADYFKSTQMRPMNSEDVVRAGLVPGLPRFRQMLEFRLKGIRYVD